MAAGSERSQAIILCPAFSTLRVRMKLFAPLPALMPQAQVKPLNPQAPQKPLTPLPLDYQPIQLSNYPTIKLSNYKTKNHPTPIDKSPRGRIIPANTTKTLKRTSKPRTAVREQDGLWWKSRPHDEAEWTSELLEERRWTVDDRRLVPLRRVIQAGILPLQG